MLIYRFLHFERFHEGVWMKAPFSLFIYKKVKNIMTKGKNGTTLLHSAWAMSMTVQQKKNGSSSLV